MRSENYIPLLAVCLGKERHTTPPGHRGGQMIIIIVCLYTILYCTVLGTPENVFNDLKGIFLRVDLFIPREPQSQGLSCVCVFTAVLSIKVAVNTV